MSEKMEKRQREREARWLREERARGRERQTDRQTDRKTDRHTDRDRDRDRERGGERLRGTQRRNTRQCRSCVFFFG